MKIIIVLLVSALKSVYCDYWSERNHFIQLEQSQAVGGSLDLNSKEKLVNKILMTKKYKEFDEGFQNSSNFPPSLHFFHSKQLVEQSKVFRFIQKIPKGASLHGHDSALVSGDFLFNLTYEENLYACNDTGYLQLRFFSINNTDNSCKWKLISDFRKINLNFNGYLRKHISLIVDDPLREYPDVNTVWKKFSNTFNTVRPMITYVKVLKQYFYEVLKELYEDNVKYLEFRGTLPPVYDLDGKVYTPVEVAGFYKEIAEKFVKEHPDFIGVRFIYAPFRRADNATALQYLKTIKELKQAHGDFVAGFDMVGQEDLGNPLTSFVDIIQQMPEDIKFFFHAGETDWYGTTTDFNLVDAVLLNVTRVGHGYALSKHPRVLQAIKQKNIAVEVCPISNQVLRLVEDLRNHPSASLIAEGYPVVICNDDPSFWGTKGLSYDWYMAFMGLASREADLRFLKQLAMNSLVHSAMNEDQKIVALEMWNRDWDSFLSKIVSSRQEFEVTRVK